MLTPDRTAVLVVSMWLVGVMLGCSPKSTSNSGSRPMSPCILHNYYPIAVRGSITTIETGVSTATLKQYPDLIATRFTVQVADVLRMPHDGSPAPSGEKSELDLLVYAPTADSNEVVEFLRTVRADAVVFARWDGTVADGEFRSCYACVLRPDSSASAEVFSGLGPFSREPIRSDQLAQIVGDGSTDAICPEPSTVNAGG